MLHLFVQQTLWVPLICQGSILGSQETAMNKWSLYSSEKMSKKQVWKYLMPGSGDIMKINGLENESAVTERQLNVEWNEQVSHVDSEEINKQTENDMCKALRSVHAWQVQRTAKRRVCLEQVSIREVAAEVRKTVMALKIMVRTLDWVLCDLGGLWKVLKRLIQSDLCFRRKTLLNGD